MRMVGSAAALVGTGVPGFGVVIPMGDLSVGELSAAVRVGARSVAYVLAHTAVRLASAVLRTWRPTSVVPFVMRSRPVPVPAVPAVESPRVPVPHTPAVLEEPASLEEPVGLGHEASDEGPSDEVHGLPARHREIALPADPTAPRRARALLQAAVQDWDVDDDLHQDAAMVVTELVANAVDHARTPSTVTVSLDGSELCVAVRDGRPDSAPRPRPVDPSAPRGRGLQMVDALAASWGVTVHADGKTVWAVLRRA